MSLINQMLRDLEQRELSTNVISPLEQQGVQITTTTPQSKHWLFMLIALISGVTAWLYQQSTKDAHKTVNLAIPEQILHITKAPEMHDIPAPTASKPQATTKQTALKPVALIKEIPRRPDLPENIISKKTKPDQDLLTKTPSQTPEQQAEKLFKQAQQTVELATAQAALEKALALNPKHIAARVLLAKTYLTQGMLQKTELLLDQGLSIFPFKLRLVNARAQLFLQQKNATAALQTLQRLDAGEINDETYLSLLAASYQQQQSFKKAVAIFKN